MYYDISFSKASNTTVASTTAETVQTTDIMANSVSITTTELGTIALPLSYMNDYSKISLGFNMKNGHVEYFCHNKFI